MAGHFFRVCEAGSRNGSARHRGPARGTVGITVAPVAAMEFLKSHPGLRSMDMEGRSLGTERPSVSFGAAEARERARFSDVLGARRVDDAEDGVIDDFARRIRDGRTDAAEASEGGGDVNDGIAERPQEEVAREAQREFQTTPGEGDAEMSVEAESSPATGEHTSSDQEPRTADGPHSGSGRDGIVRAAEVETPSDGVRVKALPGVVGAAPSRPTVRSDARTNGSISPATIGVSQPIAPPYVRPTGAGLRGAQSIPVLQVDRAGTRTSRPAAAAPPQPARPDVLARAEAVLDQLRAHVRAGEREATIQLRPYELGRIDMRVRVHGNRVRASIVAESRETLGVLEGHAPELRAWLAGDADRVNGGVGADVQLELALMDDRNADRSPRDESFARELRATGPTPNSASRFRDPAPPVQLRTSSPLTDGIDLVA